MIYEWWSVNTVSMTDIELKLSPLIKLKYLKITNYYTINENVLRLFKYLMIEVSESFRKSY